MGGVVVVTVVGGVVTVSVVGGVVVVTVMVRCLLWAVWLL